MAANDHSSNVNIIRMDDIDPSARPTISDLVEQLNESRTQLALALQEIKQLREYITKGLPDSGNPSPTRKQPKVAHQLPCTSASSNCKRPASVQHVSGNAASASNNPNKKKIFQAIDTNINTVRQTNINSKCEHFTLKQSSSKAPIKIAIDKPDEISAVRCALQNSSISFHEFKWDSEKNKCFIIRGLVGVTNDDIPSIHQELVDAGVPADSTLTLFTTGFMRACPVVTHNSLLKLVVPPTFDTNLLLSIKYIDHVAVKFEKIKNKSVVQCKNCQRFGHSAAGCKHTHRCVKCGLNYLRDACPRTLNKAVKLVCCNCGGEHSANNLSACSYFRNNYAKESSHVLSSVIVPPAKVHHNANNTAVPSKLRTTLSASFAAVASKAASVNSSKRGASLLGKPPSVNLADLSSKIDIIFQLVVKHEALLQNLDSHE